MSDKFVFDPRKVDMEPLNDTVPIGQYIAMVDKVEAKEKNGNMGYMVFFKIIHDEKYKGRSVMDYFNIKHSNDYTQKKGQQNFALLLNYTGLGKDVLKDEQDLLSKFVKLDIGVKPHWQNSQELQNCVNKYYPMTQVDLNLIKDVKVPEVSKPISNYDFEDVPF